jgi:prolyl oligopeptidase
MSVRILLVSAGFLASLILLYAEDAPPGAPIHNVEDEYWGVKINDPYRWLENVQNDAEAQKWLKAQAEFTTKTLDSLPGYQKLKTRVTELANSEPATIGRPRILSNGNQLYFKTVAGQNTAKLYFRKSASANEALLVDPDTCLASGRNEEHEA